MSSMPPTLLRAAIAILCLVAVFTPTTAESQATGSADDYFHTGAGIYTREEPEPALDVVNEGLERHPGDFYLLRLKELLEQQQEQQQEQENQDQNQDEQEQDSSDDQQQPQEQEQEEDERSADEDEQEDSQPEEQAASGQDEAQPDKAEEMTEEEAMMLLDAMKEQEQADREALLQEQMRNNMTPLVPVDKDW